MKTLHIKVFSDTVCPFCRIGKKNLLTALQELNKTDSADISYLTFFLNRDIPEEGIDYKKYLTNKIRGASLEAINEGPTRLGKQSGINFNFDKIKIIPNTVLSNTLIFLTPDDKKEQMIDKVTEAYFENGENIGDMNVLLAIASNLGVEITPEQLQDKNTQDQVLEQDHYGKSLGITGVPFFIFEDKYAVTGAQPVSAFKNVIERLEGETEILL